MKKILYLMLLVLPLLAAACAQQAPPPPATPAAAPGPEPMAHANLAQIMRTIPFVHSNVIFDAQSTDADERQAADKAAAEKAGGQSYAGTYGGWTGVEESALTLSEFANLLLIPRACSNGVQAPIGNEDWKKFTQGLIDAGMAAQKAAQMKNLDAMVDVSGVVSDACLACHEIYRDQPEPKPRCTP